MTTNPYAQMGAPQPPPPPGGGTPYGGDFGGPPLYPESRVSALAVTSFVLSLICCIPGLGLLGVLFGVPAVFAINSSKGRLRGNGFAIAGIVIGLVVTLVWLFVLIGASQGVGMYRTQIIAPVAEAVEAMEAGDRDRARTLFTPSANAAMTDEHMDNFAAAFQAEWGGFQGIAGSTGEMISDYMAGGQTMQQYRNQPNTIPVPIRFDRGVAIFLVQIDPGTPGPSPTLQGVVNLGYLDSSGREVWLIAPGTVQPGLRTPRRTPDPLPPADPDDQDPEDDQDAGDLPPG